MGTMRPTTRRMRNRRVTSTAELYCQASSGIQACPGRRRIRPVKWARSDQVGGLPMTPIARRYRAATGGSAARSASVTGRVSTGERGRPEEAIARLKTRGGRVAAPCSRTGGTGADRGRPPVGNSAQQLDEQPRADSAQDAEAG